MDWYRLTKLAFGAPLTQNSPILMNSPDILDKTEPGLGAVVSPFGNQPKSRKKKRRKTKRRPLIEDSKRPTDSAGSPRPSGDLTGG